MKVTIMILLGALLLLWGSTYYALQGDSEERYPFLDPHLEEVIYTELQIDKGSLPSHIVETVTSLDLSDSDITDLSGIENFPHLVELNLSGNHISDFGALTTLRNLLSLDLSDNKIETIDGLEQLASIETLHLEGNRIESVHPLKKMARLKTLRLADNRLTSIEPLASLVWLEELDIRGNLIKDLRALKSVPDLRSLDARYNFIEDLSPLTNKNQLRDRLLLEGNRIQSIEPIQAFYEQISETDLGELAVYVEASELGGRKAGAVEVALSIPVPSNAVIHYTTDGSVPDQNSPRYDGPIEVHQSSVVSAIALTPTGEAGNERRETYLIEETAHLPILSFSTDPANLFDEEIGIYVPGVNMNSRTEDIASTGNYAMRGQDWERPVKVEYFDKYGELVLSENAGIRIHGGASRAYDRKSFRLYARNEYGNNTFNYSFFGEDNRHLYNRLLVRNSGNDHESTLFRDAYLQALIKDDLNVETQAYQPTVLYVNGEYWGIYNLRERYDQHYFERELGIHPDDLDLLERDGEIAEGRNAQWEHVKAYIRANDLSDPIHYQQVQQWIDLDNFIDYNLAQIFVRNTDWPGNNHQFYRDRKAGDLWRWVIFDLDFGFGLYGRPHAFRHHTLDMATEAGRDSLPNPDWSTLVLRSLLDNESFRHDFINRMTYYLNTVFHPDRTLPLLDEMAAVIEPEMPNHIKRWGQPATYEDWESNVDIMRQFATERPAYMLAHLADHFELDGYATMRVDEALRQQLSIDGYPLWREDLPGDRLYRWMTGVPISISHENSLARIETDNEAVVTVLHENKLFFNEPGEATLSLYDEANQLLGELPITVEHFQMSAETWQLSDERELGEGVWLSSDDAIVTIEAGTATAVGTGTALLTRKADEKLVNIIRIDVIDD